MEDTAIKIFKETATGQTAIRVDISSGIDILGLPFMVCQIGERSIRLLLDTGASMNFLRKEIIDEFSDDAQLLPYKTHFYGIDNVGHEANVFSLAINLGPHVFLEDFQELLVDDALKLSLGEEFIQLDGILGYPFFSKYNACFSYGSKIMYITIPEEVSLRTMAS